MGKRGDSDLLQIIGTGDAATRFPRALYGRKQKRNQDSDDRDDHQQLDERKPTGASRHGRPSESAFGHRQSHRGAPLPFTSIETGPREGVNESVRNCRGEGILTRLADIEGQRRGPNSRAAAKRLPIDQYGER
jgi:hypothetical protein